MFKHALAAAAALGLSTAPALADEFTDVLSSALQAYEEGDITIAREELDYAVTLLKEMKSESLSAYLPEPLPGWTREDAEGDGAGMAMAMLGGGTTAAAKYSNGTTDMTITLIANSPVVSSIGGMITGMASLGGGKPTRIQRTQFADNDGEMQGVIDNRILVSVSGQASVEDKTAQLDAMDFSALRDF
jgi:hypothetical protein